MRYAALAASTAALLLSTTSLSAQAADPAFENVYVDVEGAAVLVAVALASEACGLDESMIQQVATERLQESGLDPALMQVASAEAHSEGTEMASAGTESAMNLAADEAAETSSDGSGTAVTEGNARAASVLEDTATTAATEAGDDAVAVPDASNETVTTAQGTADPTTAEPGDEMLALAVCQIDVVRAGELGIPQANEIVTD